MRRSARLFSAAALLILCSCANETRGPEPLPIDTHIIYAEIDPDGSFLSCEDVLTVNLERGDAGRFYFFLNEAFTIKRIATGGGTLSFSTAAEPRLEEYLAEIEDEDRDFYSNASIVVLDLPSGNENVPESGPRSLVVSYSGVVYDSLRVPEYSRGVEAEQTRGLIDPRGTFLGPSTHWYPSAERRRAIFNVTGVAPEGYEVVAQGRLASRRSRSGRVETVWKGTHPFEEAYLVAGPYKVKALEHAGVALYTYFYESEADLSEQYLAACARYIDMYNELLGSYPYAKFAVVENFFPTGYGMPSYTLLGRRVLRLPFIVHTSLGHEIAHNWWGNGVFIDPEGGNWCEGLTTYCADYRYKLLNGPKDAREYRKDINRDFTVYVTPENDMPLTEFAGRTTRATRAIGYGKCAMVFHMLQQLMGEDAFFKTLRAIISKHMLRQIGWTEIQEEFSAAHGGDLDWFFAQWVRETGAPLLKITKAVAIDTWPEYTLELRLEQVGGPFRLSVPIMVRTETTQYLRTVEITEAVAEVDFKFRSVPTLVSVDPDHNLLRRMSSKEIAPTLSAVLGDDETIIVKPSVTSAEAAAAYDALAEQLSRTGEARVIDDSELTESQVASHSLFVLGGGGENAAHEMLGEGWSKGAFSKKGSYTVQERNYSSTNDCVLFVGRNPGNPEKAIAALAGLSGEAVAACSRKIVHYGKYGYVVFEAGQAVDKGTWNIRDYPWMSVKFRTTG